MDCTNQLTRQRDLAGEVRARSCAATRFGALVCSVLLTAGTLASSTRADPGTTITFGTSPAVIVTDGAGRPGEALAAARAETLVDPERLMAHVRSLPTKRAAFSDQEHRQGLLDTEALLARTLREMGHEPVLEPIDFLGSRVSESEPKDGANEREAESKEKDAPWHNVYVDLPGMAGEGDAAKEWLIIGAHFDAVSRSPGADDNGSGTAALLEAARVLKDRPMQRSVRLIFFNLEEVGLVGSRAHAGRLQPLLESGEMQVAGMVSLDMLGFYSDKPNSQKSPIPASKMFTPPSVADFIGLGGILMHRTFSQAWVKAMEASAPGDGTDPKTKVKVIAVDFLPIAPPDLLRSDHAPFLALNVPAIVLSDTANFRSPHYHRPTDTVETLDVERFTTTTRAVVGAIERLAGRPGEELVVLKPGEVK